LNKIDGAADENSYVQCKNVPKLFALSP